MRRLLRPLTYTVLAAAALLAFVAAGRVTPSPLTVPDVGSWLNRADPVDALVELARWTGIALSAYVALVSLLALLGELAGLASLAPLQRLLHRLVRLFALPALRRRLIELGAAATITASTLPSLAFAAAPGAVAVASAPLSPAPRQPVLLRAAYEGFEIPATLPAPAADNEVHVIQHGDTLWAIISDHYGHCDRALLDTVVQANPFIHDPNLIQIGWRISLPVVDLAMPPPAPVVPQGDATWAGVTVQRGDTLWGIVERHYGTATGELVWAVVDANPTIDDPSLIYPGQVLTLPPIGAEVPTPVPAPLPPPDVAAAPAETIPTLPPPSPTSVPFPPPSVTTVVVTEPPALPDVPSPATTTTTEEVVTEVSPASVGGATDFEVVAGDDVPRPPIAQIVGWSGGAALAAAILALATRRRRRLPRSERLRRLGRRAAQVGVALRVTENLTTVEWASLALRELATRLRPVPGQPTPVPRLLRLAGDDIELVWDTPAPDVLEPWMSPDGGWSWTLHRPDDFDVRGTPHPCAAFVTIGRRDGADVLLNLESCGAVAVVGDSTAVDDLVRSVCVELGASVFADSPTVLVVGVSDDLPGRPDHARAATAEEAIGWLRDRSESASALLASRRLTSLFSLRARSQPRDSHEPVIVVVDAFSADEDQLGRLVELANGDVGALVVVLGDHPSVSWRLRLHDALVVIEPLGLELDSVGMSAQLAEVIGEIVPTTDDEMDEEEGAATASIEHVDAELAFPLVLVDPADEVALDPDDEDFDVELKVLGQVRAFGTKQPLTPTELHLAIYLAFHRNGENADTISTMIWPDGAAPKTLINTMASLRRKLGTGNDGQMLFPLGRDTQYTYRLSNRVVTDWDRFVALARQAEGAEPERAIALLERAVDLIDGPPFRASAGYSWAYSEGLATMVSEGVVRVIARLQELHLEVEDEEEALTAGLRVLTLIDSPLDAEGVIRRTADLFDSLGSPSQAAGLRARLESGIDY